MTRIPRTTHGLASTYTNESAEGQSKSLNEMTPVCRRCVAEQTHPATARTMHSISRRQMPSISSRGHKQPDSPSGSFFAYGIFKPGQLAYRQIEEFVLEADGTATVEGTLRERDGLPILKAGGDGQVRGALLTFRPDAERDAYAIINDLEPECQYRWEKVQVFTAAGHGKAAALVGRKPDKGSIPLETDEWDGSNDPLFTSALDVIAEVLEANRTFAWDLKPLFRLEMAYLLLWSALERFASFSYHLGSEPWQKVKQLATEPAFAETLRREVRESRRLYRADRAGHDVTLSPTDPAKSVEYYYQVRSNITHRGKGVVRDHEILWNSLSELLAIFRGILDATFPRHVRSRAECAQADV